MQKVFLAITAKGLQQALAASSETGAAVWCGADAVSEQDYKLHSASSLSRFNFPLAAASEDVFSGAVDTIRDHHPEDTIWIESTV